MQLRPDHDGVFVQSNYGAFVTVEEICWSFLRGGCLVAMDKW